MWKRGVGFRVGVSGVYTRSAVKSAVGHSASDACTSTRMPSGSFPRMRPMHEARVAEVDRSPSSTACRCCRSSSERRRPGGALIGNQDLIDGVFTSLDTEVRWASPAGGRRPEPPAPPPSGGDLRWAPPRAQGDPLRRADAEPRPCIASPLRAGTGRAAGPRTRSASASATPSPDRIWRFETALKDFGEAVRIAGDISSVLDVDVSLQGRFGQDAERPNQRQLTAVIPAGSSGRA